MGELQKEKEEKRRKAAAADAENRTEKSDMKVLAALNAPDTPAARIKYFCSLLLKQGMAVKDGEWGSRLSTYDYFFDIYSDGVEKAVSEWTGAGVTGK